MSLYGFYQQCLIILVPNGVGKSTWKVKLVPTFAIFIIALIMGGQDYLEG